jgi:hypothetical protein
MKDRYVTAYMVTRHYGGPEEGGWWYNLYIATKTKRIPRIYQKNTQRALKKIWALADGLKTECSSFEWGNIYHSTGGVAIDVVIENIRHENETTERPHYC